MNFLFDRWFENVLKQYVLVVSVSVGQCRGRKLLGMSGCRWAADIKVVVRLKIGCGLD
jgi:hypothetical protein